MLDPNKEVIKWKPFNKHEVVRKGKAIYEKIREKMEAEHKCEALAIEVESTVESGNGEKVNSAW